MSGVDTRIVIVGIPTIARELGTDVEGVIWITQAYLLASTIGLLLIGRITDLIGRVKIYNIGFAIFTVGSALSALSFSSTELIAARIVQGTGAAMILTNSAAILTDATPRNQLGTILGLNQIAFRIGSVAGLTLSGLILAVTDWRALFYINIPIGIFGTVWAHLRLREISTKEGSRKMDWLGFATFSIALTMILVSLTFLSYGLSDTRIGIALAVFGFITLGLFVRIETKTDSPVLDLRLFKIREFMGGNIAQLLNGLAFSGIVLLMSLYLQLALKFDPLKAGLSLLPLDGAYAIAGPLSGKLSDKYGPRWFSTIGLLISSAGFFYLGASARSESYPNVVLTLLLMGAGNGMFVSPNISSIMGSVPPNRRGIASGFRVTMVNVGLTASSGLAVLLITLGGLPYSVFSGLLSGASGLQLGSQLAIQEFVFGFQIAALTLAAINTVAIIPSFLRGPRHFYEAPVSEQADETHPGISAPD